MSKGLQVNKHETNNGAKYQKFIDIAFTNVLKLGLCLILVNLIEKEGRCHSDKDKHCLPDILKFSFGLEWIVGFRLQFSRGFLLLCHLLYDLLVGNLTCVKIVGLID